MIFFGMVTHNPLGGSSPAVARECSWLVPAGVTRMAGTDRKEQA